MLALLLTLTSQVLPSGPCVPSKARPLDATLLGVPVNAPGDVSAQLNAALATAAAAHRPLYLPPGTYRIAHPVRPLASSILFGSTTATTTIAAIPQTWPITEAMVEIAGVSNVRVCHLTLDAQGTAPQQALSFAMVLSNTASDLIQNVRFRNLGLTGSLPTGPALLMIARQLGDTPYIVSQKKDVGQLGSVEAVRVEGCRFDLPTTTGLAFAIRVYSEFGIQRTEANTLAHNRGHLLIGNRFTGDFFWNTIELAGRGTRENILEGNDFHGHTLAHIDFDKGASFNIARGNHIVRAGRPVLGFDASARASAIADHGSDTNYRSTYNEISDNVIDLVDTVSYADEGGIYMQYTTGAYVARNQITNVAGGLLGAGIVMNGDIEGATLTGNTIGTPTVVPPPIALGIWSPATVQRMDGNYLWWNTIHAQKGGIQVGAIVSGCPTTNIFGSTWTGWDVEANTLFVSDSAFNGMSLGLVAPWVAFNTVTGGSSGMYLIAPDATVQSNSVSGTVGRAYNISLGPVTFVNNLPATFACVAQCGAVSVPAAYCPPP